MKINCVKISYNDKYTPLTFMKKPRINIKESNTPNTYYKHKDQITYSNAKIISKINMKTTWKDTYKVKLNTIIDFVPGDSIGIYAPNNIDLANSLLKYLNIENKHYLIETDTFVYEGMLLDFFINYFDFTSLPKKAFLNDISKNAKQKKELEYLISKDGVKDYLGLMKNWNNVLDILYTFGCKVSLEDILRNCQIIKPRYYSLINKINEEAKFLICINEKEVEVIDDNTNQMLVSDYEKNPKLKEKRYGHISDFLLHSNATDIKFIHRQSKLIRMSYEHDILCICTGTGISPFLSFIRNKKDSQKIKLIYGFRSPEDDLTKNEDFSNIPNLEIIKVMSSKGQYVTDIITEEHVKDNWLVYVCGNPNMERSVYDIFVKNYKKIVNDKRLFFDSWL